MKPSSHWIWLGCFLQLLAWTEQQQEAEPPPPPPVDDPMEVEGADQVIQDVQKILREVTERQQAAEVLLGQQLIVEAMRGRGVIGQARVLRRVGEPDDLDAATEGYAARLDLHLDRLSRECQLSDSQLKKLRLVAKGMVDRRKNRVATFRKVQEDLKAQEGDDAGPLLVPLRQRLALAQEGEIGLESEELTMDPDQAIRADDVWNKMLKKLLDESQWQAMQRANAKRRQFKINLAVESVVDALDDALLLSESQRQFVKAQLMSQCHPAMGDQQSQVLESQALSLARADGAGWLGRILSDTQAKAFEEWKKPDRDFLQGRAMGGRIIRWR